MALVARVARYRLPSTLALEVWQSIIGNRCTRIPQAAEYRRFGVGQCQSGERAVSRVLFTDMRRCAVIPLGCPLPDDSNGLPGHRPGRAGNGADHSFASVWPFSGWGLPCQGRHRPRGELLPHHFTLTGDPRISGGIFSVALSLGSLPVDVSHHPALRSSDFPRHGRTMPRPLHPLTIGHGTEIASILEELSDRFDDQTQKQHSACSTEEIASGLPMKSVFPVCCAGY